MTASYTVRTAKGDKSFTPGSGYVLPHEHIICDLRARWSGEGDAHDLDAPGLALGPEAIDAVRRDSQGTVRENLMLSDWYVASQELLEARRSGCALIVDLTAHGLGAMPSLAVRAADAAGLDTVIAVGRYIVAALTPEERDLPSAALAEEWTKAAENGIDGCAVGVIGEIGLSVDMHEAERRSLEAAAITHQRTGLAVNVHIEPGYGLGNAHEALSVLESGGTDPAKIAFSHIDYETDRDALIELARRGCYLEFDLFARAYPPVSEPDRVDMITSLVEAGHGDRVLLSQDICMRHGLRRWGGPGYAHLAREIHPVLRDRLGAAGTQLLISENPLRFLSLAP